MPTNPAYQQHGLYGREYAPPINIASLLAPIPNGDESIVVAAAGVKTLTPPDGSILAEIPYAPVDLWVRFGAVPALNTGGYYPAGSYVTFDSPEKIATAQIYVTGACTLFVQYSK